MNVRLIDLQKCCDAILSALSRFSGEGFQNLVEPITPRTEARCSVMPPLMQCLGTASSEVSVAVAVFSVLLL